MRKALSATA